MSLCQQCIDWATDENRVYLRQALQVRIDTVHVMVHIMVVRNIVLYARYYSTFKFYSHTNAHVQCTCMYMCIMYTSMHVHVD